MPAALFLSPARRLGPPLGSPSTPPSTSDPVPDSPLHSAGFAACRRRGLPSLSPGPLGDALLKMPLQTYI
ncbi:hypothetical protein E2562_022492 [Oryza meyeriana var. granulata]|uniref:Uncharacterized protein n=1 Tax=Oryza meyeriana var. granulata TaxID=110450 RepID=A0A6G1BPE1_9ORYZ|nr:hypothetical protein E2562_022492 [Oryza meyeriana var. granulata]